MAEETDSAVLTAILVFIIGPSLGDFFVYIFLHCLCHNASISHSFLFLQLLFPQLAFLPTLNASSFRIGGSCSLIVICGIFSTKTLLQGLLII